jgi:hypothetical protein
MSKLKKLKGSKLSTLLTEAEFHALRRKIPCGLDDRGLDQLSEVAVDTGIR